VLDRVASTGAASKLEMRVAGHAIALCPPRLARLYLFEDKPGEVRRWVRRYRGSEGPVRGGPHKGVGTVAYSRVGGDSAYGPTVTIFAIDGTPDPLMRKSM
jgi:hypothetical protein